VLVINAFVNCNLDRHGRTACESDRAGGGRSRPVSDEREANARVSDRRRELCASSLRFMAAPPRVASPPFTRTVRVHTAAMAAGGRRPRTPEDSAAAPTTSVRIRDRLRRTRRTVGAMAIARRREATVVQATALPRPARGRRDS
jgi:hypothetical protein